jgi:hypothetical protein
MALGTGSNTQIGYIEETVVGTTPATPAFNVVAINDFNINVTKEIINDPSIRLDAQEHFVKHGNVTVGGEAGVTYVGVGTSPTGNLVYDPWLESLFRTDFTSEVLKLADDGGTQKTFTVEKKLTDITGSSQYFRYTGIECSSVSFEWALNQPLITKFAFMGLDEDPLASTAIAGSTYVAQPTALEPFIHVTSGNAFKEGGSATTLMTSCSISITRDLTPNHGLGNDIAVANTPSGKWKIEGSATYFFSDATLYNKFRNETDSVIDILTTNGSEGIQVILPKVVYKEATQSVDNEGTLTVTMPFEAVYDSGISSAVSITRS